MGRKIVKMRRIINEKTRITTYKKRKACLFKKATELSTLCGIDTCVVVYGPSQPGEELVLEPELWPKDESKIRNIITKYKDTAFSSCTKTYTVQECLEKKNKEKPVKYSSWDNKLDLYSLQELFAVFTTVQSKIQEVEKRQNWNQMDPETYWSNYQCFDQTQELQQHQEQKFFAYGVDDQTEMAPVSSMTESEIAEALMRMRGNEKQNLCSVFYDGQYGHFGQYGEYCPMMQQQWSLGNNLVFNNGMQFTDYIP